MYLNRVVAILTPILAGLIVQVVPSEEVAFTLAGALLACAITWLHGWQKFERFEQELDLILAGRDGEALTAGPSSPAVLVDELPRVADLTPAAQEAVRPSGQL